MSGLLNAGSTGSDLQEGWSQRAADILEGLYDDSFTGRGPTPDFAMVISGSGARRESCPYSDLDCFILVRAATPATQQYFLDATQQIADWLNDLEFGRGMRFCTVLSPWGPRDATWNHPLVNTPHYMASLLENGEMNNGHIVSGLQESAFGWGNEDLYDEFQTDVDNILGRRDWTIWSRAGISRRKRIGLETVESAVTQSGPGRDFEVPDPADDNFHIKNQFYRLPQFVMKGLAWYYDIAEVNTEAQMRQLVQAGHMSPVVANNFKPIFDAFARVRFRAHLHAEGEKDRVWVRNRPASNKDELDLTDEEAGTLRSLVANLRYIRTKAEEFVAQKRKAFGKRKNPFV